MHVCVCVRVCVRNSVYASPRCHVTYRNSCISQTKIGRPASAGARGSPLRVTKKGQFVAFRPRCTLLAHGSARASKGSAHREPNAWYVGSANFCGSPSPSQSSLVTRRFVDLFGDPQIAPHPPSRVVALSRCRTCVRDGGWMCAHVALPRRCVYMYTHAHVVALSCT